MHIDTNINCGKVQGCPVPVVALNDPVTGKCFFLFNFALLDAEKEIVLWEKRRKNWTVPSTYSSLCL